MNNLLETKITSLQSQYRNLLHQLFDCVSDHNNDAGILDEINIFWYSNIDIVKLYLSYHASKLDCYIFTGATYLDFDDLEHYPFLMLGKLHILDDPFCKYLEISKNQNNQIASAKFGEQLYLSAKDNLKILDNLNGEILILPVRLLNQDQFTNQIFQVAEQVFLLLFSNISSISDFFYKCESFNDIKIHIIEEASNYILFSEDDNKTKSFEERFMDAIITLDGILEIEASDSKKFFMLVFGPIQQAVDILFNCIEYNCVPFLRYPVALNYFLLLVDNFVSIDGVQEIKFKAIISNILYRNFDKGRLGIGDFDDFINIRNEIGFSNMLYDSLNKNGINDESFRLEPSITLVNEKLDLFFTRLWRK